MEFAFKWRWFEAQQNPEDDIEAQQIQKDDQFNHLESINNSILHIPGLYNISEVDIVDWLDSEKADDFVQFNDTECKLEEEIISEKAPISGPSHSDALLLQI